jgi:cell division protein FtsN
MYCKKCNIVVHGAGQGICPKCNDPLDQPSESLHAEPVNAVDWQKLKSLISDIDATAKLTEKLKTEKEKGTPFDLGKALSAERMEKSAGDPPHTKEIPDITVKEFSPESTPQPVLNQNPKYGVMNSIFIILVVLIVAGIAAAYYFYFKEPEPAKRSFVLPSKAAPVGVPQAQADKENLILKPAVQDQNSADGRQPDPGKKGASQPVSVPAALPTPETAAPPARKAGTLSPAIKENKPAEQAQAAALIEKKQAALPAEEKKAIAPPRQEAAVKATMYCINVASCKIKESADAVMWDLQKKGYKPAVDTISVKDTTWYRVTLGSFKTKGEAQNYARELQGRENIRGFVVKKKF